MEKKLVALLLSAFVPGLGQLYNGQFWKGVAVHISMWIAALLCFVVIGFLLLPIVWLAGCWDAMVNARDEQA
jgi:TM2 domain-containing membrane protein YozV